MSTRRQGTTLLTALVAFIATLVIIQLWLVAASVEAWLSGQAGVLIPATAASVALFLINGGLLRYALRFDQGLPGERDRRRY